MQYFATYAKNAVTLMSCLLHIKQLLSLTVTKYKNSFFIPWSLARTETEEGTKNDYYDGLRIAYCFVQFCMFRISIFFEKFVLKKNLNFRPILIKLNASKTWHKH